MLSLYYVTATFLQSWRIKKACTKIAEKFSEKSSVVFYVLPKEGYEENMVTSELCTNRSEARVSDLLWLFADQRGCCLMPSQSVHIGPWVTFPESPTLIPFESIAHEEELILDRNKIVHLLLETDILPSSVESSTDNIMIEKYGKPIAWKVDSHFAVLLETDIDNFTSLLIATFLQNNLYINDWLPLIRIESVSYEGQPQPFEMMKKHLRKQLTSRSETQLSEDNWKKHLDGLRSLSVLANQATEFEYNKNRTEGKTGIVKPDLIPSGKIPSDLPSQSIDDAIESVKSSPVKISGEKQKIEAKVSPMKRVPEEPVIKKAPSPMKSPAKSPAKYLVESRKEEIKSKPTEVPVESKSSPSVESVLVTAKIEPIPRSIPEPTNVSKEARKEERKADPLPKKVPEPISAVKNNTKRPSLRRSKDSVKECKPPNVLVYSDVATSRDSVVATLKNLLERDMYTVYPLTSQQVQEKSWIDNTSLLVICGSVPSNLGEILVDYFLCGGKLLSLCSDVLHIVLPTYRTAEVREHELVQFSYDKWQKVKMMHYIFCYHPSPVKKNFSTDSEESGSTLSKKPALVCPRSIELKDLQGDMHNLDVKVLGNEETWNTPSLLLANNVKSGGRAVFSQVHLETDPSEYESDDTKYKILKENERNRLEIFADLLVKHLGLTIKKQPVLQDHPKITYQNAYFLGRYELKFEALQKLERLYDAEKMIKTSKLSMKFCGKNETLPSANTNLLPILLHSCPEDFSTVDYFDNLVTSDIGRLVIYAPIISSSMHVISDLELVHGLAVLPKQQTDGVGRSSNQWLSPLGCAMFSLQLHIPLDSELGSRLPLIQHIIGLSVVSAIKQQDKYQFLDLGVKWPNDIYVNGLTKIGGLVVTSKCIGKNVIINVGLGFNLDNKTPTICLNDLIEEYNRNTHQAIAKLNYELWMALVFNEIERLTNMVQSGHMDQVYELYYKYWLHDQQEVDIQDKNGRKDHATIIGIDDYGFLKIKTRNGKIESVQPDGNSFDMLKGLILPKFN